MDEKKQVLVIQTIVSPEILLPDWNQGLVGLLIDYIIHHRVQQAVLVFPDKLGLLHFLHRCVLYAN